MTCLSLDKVTLRVGARTLLRDFSITVPAGGIATVMGPSGAGKSSLLAFACGTLPRGLSASGRVGVAGTDITALPAHHRRLGILFQDDLLFPHMTVGENLLFGMSPRVAGRAARRAAATAALAEAELPEFQDRDPASLSGGQRARVALMRVLLSRPRALLLDEPFSRLDAALRARFRDMVFAAAAARNLPVLLVTHDQADAAGEIVTLRVETAID